MNHEAIQDCRYAKSLGEVALQEHIRHWSHPAAVENTEDRQYQLAILEIARKLGTSEDLLEERK